MHPIEYVKVDARDGRPTTEYPARHGPADPIPGIQPLWFERGQPPRYVGLAPEGTDLTTPGILREIPADEWDELIEQQRQTILGELAAHRYRVETGGIEVNGTLVRTDRESQAQINSAYTSLREGFVATADFKGANGWVTITLEEITPIATAVARHAQGCFTAERRVAEQIAAATDATALNAIHIRQEFEAALSTSA